MATLLEPALHAAEPRLAIAALVPQSCRAQQETTMTSGRKRKGLTKKTRFEVFKRDSFTCQYCGKAAPDVILHCDHIHPVAKGGEDDVMNLITSCVDCNAGKRDRTLDDSSVVSRQRSQLQELQERREQLD